MKDNREKLMKLFKKLGIERDSEEIVRDVEKMDERELELLVMMCEEILNYRKVIDDTARKVDPKKYEEMKNKYHKKLEQLEDKLIDKKEKMQEEVDDDFDKLEVNVRSKLKRFQGEYYQKIEDLKKIAPLNDSNKSE